MNAHLPGSNLSRILIVALALTLALVPLASAQEGPAMPLAEPGPYGVGEKRVTLVDPDREGRALVVMIWYPAQAGAVSYVMPKRDAEPDATGAPYPLIIYSIPLWSTATLSVAEYLVTHGYVVASIQHPEPIGDPNFWTGVVDRPLDILLVLDQLPALSGAEIAGMVDAESVGIAGYSYGGMTSLWMAGAPIDPEYLASWCAANEPGATPNTSFSGSSCEVFLTRWTELSVYRGRFGALAEGNVWPPLKDERIDAVFSIAPCFSPLIGEEGPAAVNVPTLVVYPEKDEICKPSDGARVIYEHLGSADRYLLTLLDAGHASVMELSSDKSLLRQVGVAFFGYYLQGREEYAQYLTEEYVESLPNVAWESSLE